MAIFHKYCLLSKGGCGQKLFPDLSLPLQEQHYLYNNCFPSPVTTLMAILRFKALELVNQRRPITVVPVAARRSDSFGQSVFNLEAMRATMPGDYFKKLQADQLS